MSYHATIPKKLIYDQTIRDVDIRMYLVISQNCNDKGFSVISNDKLEKLSGKSRASIKRTLAKLVSNGHLVVKYNTKRNDIYDRPHDRVIWLSEIYADYTRKRKSSKVRVKSKENDFIVFVTWLKTDLKNIKFNVSLGGLTQDYYIHGDGLLYLHARGEEPELLDKYDSKDVFLKIFRNKKKIFKVSDHESEEFKTMLNAINTINEAN